MTSNTITASGKKSKRYIYIIGLGADPGTIFYWRGLEGGFCLLGGIRIKSIFSNFDFVCKFDKSEFCGP